jgi:hypothetical protein
LRSKGKSGEQAIFRRFKESSVSRKKSHPAVLNQPAVFQRVPAPKSSANLPRILFAIADADLAYTERRIWRLATRLKAQTGWQIVALTQDNGAAEAAKSHKLESQLVKIEPAPVTVNDRLLATDGMIRETADIMIPGSQLPLWKVLAMDDFLASLQLFGAYPKVSLNGDLLIVPMMGVDNNSRGACGLYTWAVAQARRNGLPVIGLEVSPLGNKQTLSQLPADHYAVKRHWSKDFLVREGMARPDQVSVLRSEESYFLWPGSDEFTEGYLQVEDKVREMLNVPRDRFVVFLPHHVAFLWEARQILAALARVDFPVTVVIRVDARTVRRHYHEREIVAQAYAKELEQLSSVVIDERVGVGLLLQFADLIVAPFAGTVTERAALCRKPTIICQAMGQQGWRGEFTYWEPEPDKIPALLHEWKNNGFLERARLASLAQSLIKQKATAAA